MSTQTLQEQEAIARQWLESGRCPKDFIHPQGGIYTEILALMEDFIKVHCQNEVTSENLDSSVNYIRLNLQKQPAPPPASPDPVDLRNGAVARKWLKERCPSHFLNEKRSGIGKEFAAKMAAYIRDHYQNQWTLDNLDAAAKYLQLRNELPDTRKKTDHSEEAKNQKLISVGAAVLSGLVNHAHKQEEKPQVTSFSSFVNGFLKDMKTANTKTGERPKSTEVPLRRIPLDAQPQDLKKYNAAEIRFWMQRKRA